MGGNIITSGVYVNVQLGLACLPSSILWLHGQVLLGTPGSHRVCVGPSAIPSWMALGLWQYQSGF